MAGEIPNYKFQIPNKLQIPISNDPLTPSLSPAGEREGVRG